MAENQNAGTKIPAEIAALSFEEALAQLQDLVKKLERGDNKLDEAIGSYERGALLKQHCEASKQGAGSRRSPGRRLIEALNFQRAEDAADRLCRGSGHGCPR